MHLNDYIILSSIAGLCLSAIGFFVKNQISVVKLKRDMVSRDKTMDLQISSLKTDILRLESEINCLVTTINRIEAKYKETENK